MDQHQRELEREASSGDVEAEAKLLLKRVRAGDLTEERLRLAAGLGHEPANLHAPYTLAALVAALLSAWEADWEELGLPKPTGWPFGDEAALRSAIGVVRCRVAGFMSHEAVSNALDLLDNRALGLPERTLMSASEELAGFTLAQADGEPQDCDGWLDTLSGFLMDSSLTGIAGALDWSWEDVETGHLVTDQLRDGLRDELLPWALGTGDPVRDRVEARQREARGD